MARRGGLGAVDDLIWIVLLGGVAYVGYYAISGSAKGRVCGSKSPAEVYNAEGNIGSLVASFVKRNASPPLTNSLASVKATVMNYKAALDDMLQKNLCQYDIDPNRSPPDFWKAFASFTLYFISQHHITLKSNAMSVLNTMRSTGNGNLITSAYAKSYETINPNYNPYGFLLADSIYNVYENRYRYSFRSGRKERELAEAIPISNTDAPESR